MSDLQESVASTLERQKDIKDSIISSVKPIIEETILKTVTPLIERSVSENLKTIKDDVTQISKTIATTNVPINPVDYHNTVNCVRINGIFEDRNKSFSENTMDTSAKLEELFAVLNVRAEVSSVKRLGKFDPARVRPRTVMVEFKSPCDARKVLARSIEKSDILHKENIFVQPALTREDARTENAILKRRLELINQGVDPKVLKIRNLQLFNDGILEPIVSDDSKPQQ